MAIAEARAVIYPDSDGEPLAETQTHVWVILSLLSRLSRYLGKRAAGGGRCESISLLHRGESEGGTGCDGGVRDRARSVPQLQIMGRETNTGDYY
jgi:hypothetical protein